MCFAKLVMKNKEVWDLLEALNGEYICGKSLVISHLDIPVVFVFGSEEAFLNSRLPMFTSPHQPE